MPNMLQRAGRPFSLLLVFRGLWGVPFRLSMGHAWNGTANAGGFARAPMPRILQRRGSLGLQRNTSINSTEIRISRIIGFPPNTSGLLVIL
jgi:hypothetical protein